MADIEISKRYQAANGALNDCRVLELLHEFEPTVVSTIWVGLDTDASDIDIVCHYENVDEFVVAVEQRLQKCEQFLVLRDEKKVLVRFSECGFLIEIYASNTPIPQQLGYRHFKVMEKLVQRGGKKFQEKVKQFKQQDIKTEPAIAGVLGLVGDPYQSVLEIETWTEEKLSSKLQAIL